MKNKKTLYLTLCITYDALEVHANFQNWSMNNDINIWGMHELASNINITIVTKRKPYGICNYACVGT